MLTVSESKIELPPWTSAILISSSTFEKSGTESSVVVQKCSISNDVEELHGIVETSAFPDMGGSVSVSIIGCSFNSQRILGKDGISLSLTRSARKNEEDVGTISSSLIGCSFVNMSSIDTSRQPNLPHLNQKMLGCVVSLTSSHLSGSTIRDVNNGGSFLCSNSSFSSLISSPNTDTDSSEPTVTLPGKSTPDAFEEDQIYSFDNTSGNHETSAIFSNCHFSGANYAQNDRPLTFNEYPGTISIISCSFTNIDLHYLTPAAVFVVVKEQFNHTCLSMLSSNFTNWACITPVGYRNPVGCGNSVGCEKEPCRL
ncbi:hypothetical protein BLNAU_9715 [Blattamonas nauphoetae]|uniref:Uncharacterized protein n=1 Tax=Blattamonas nauphoetae TaxID=2049346 RepID=A0ABQ9XV13_9EUKA|nr:hypothetical protein BLNAU_9715 [Blattamonas nauphoetae]